MIDTAAFIQQLRGSGGYETPAHVEREWLDKLLGRTTLWYHRRVFGVILKGGRMARNKNWNRDTWQNLSLDMWRGVEGCGGKLKAEGGHNLAGLSSPAVIVANHMSLLETFTIPAIVLPFQLMTFVVKESLLQVPLFRDVMSGVRPISVKRENPREDFKKLMKEGPSVLAEGRSIVVFPQSTRSRAFKPDQFNTIGMKMAKAAGVPLIALALKTDFHGLGKWFRDFGPVDQRQTVHFSFAPPLRVDGNGREAHEACVQFIASRFTDWGGEVTRESNAESNGPGKRG